VAWRFGRRTPVAGRAAAALALLALAGAGPVEPRLREGRFEGRAWRLYVPSAAGRGTLVVALHGCWQTPEDFAAGTRLDEAAERRGLVVLYPAQGRRDNPSRCWNWFEPADAGPGPETRQLTRLIAAVPREQGIEADRLVVLGFSAGGYAAVNLACAGPPAVQGVGVMAGGPYRCGSGPQGALECMRGERLDAERSAAACRAAMGGRTRAVRASLWQGDRDSVVRPSSLTALAGMLARLAGARPAPPERTDGGATRTVYRDPRGRPVIEAWLVAGMGHAWSGGSPRGSHTFVAGPPATERMLDFLLAEP